MPRRAIAGFAAATWGLGLAGGAAVLAIGALTPDAGFGVRTSVASAESVDGARASVVSLPIDRPPPRISIRNAGEAIAARPPVIPFTNVAATALRNGFEVWNDRPGVAVFDFDRDGDMDFYVTAEAGYPNWLYRNEGDGTFTDVGKLAGVGLSAVESNSTGVVAGQSHLDFWRPH